MLSEAKRIRSRWNPEKNQKLKNERAISFEEVIYHIQQGNKAPSPLMGEGWDGGGSRKATKKYLGK